MKKRIRRQQSALVLSFCFFLWALMNENCAFVNEFESRVYKGRILHKLALHQSVAITEEVLQSTTKSNSTVLAKSFNNNLSQTIPNIVNIEQ